MPSAVIQPIFVHSDEVTCNAMGVIRLARAVVVSPTPPAGGIFGTENINVAEVAVAGARPFGFARYAAALNDQFPVIRANWIIPLVAGAAIVAGNYLALDNQGRVIPYVAGGTPSVDPLVIGVAVDSQAVVDSLVGVAVTCF